MPPNNSHKKNYSKSSHWPKIFILAGIALIITVIIIVKNQSVEQPGSTANQTAEALLDQYLGRQANFVFFHSNNCQSCIDMIAVVNQVYPDYKNTVALVDVNVYDQQIRICCGEPIYTQFQPRCLSTELDRGK